MKWNVTNIVENAEQFAGYETSTTISDNYVGDYVEAYSEEEAIDLAIDAICESINENSDDYAEVKDGEIYVYDQDGNVVWHYFCFAADPVEQNAYCLTVKVFGAEGHRQRASFGESETFDYSDTENDGMVRFIEILRSDVTGTNDFVIMRVIRETREDCIDEICGQLSNGLFENGRYGKVFEICSDGTEIERDW